MAANHAVQVDDQNAVLHVLDDEAIDLLQVGDVDAALRGELLAGLGVAAERESDTDGGEIAEADQTGLEDLRGRYQSLDQAPAIERGQHRARQSGVEEGDLRAHQPPARGELGKDQDRQRTASVAACVHQERDEHDVPEQQGQQYAGSGTPSDSRCIHPKVRMP